MTQHLYNGVLFSKIMLFSDVGKRILPKNIFSFLSPTVLQTMAITKRVARERETFFQCLSRWRADTTGGGAAFSGIRRRSSELALDTSELTC